MAVSDAKAITWKLDKLSELDVENVLFRFGSKYVSEKVKTNSLSFEQIEMPMITSYTHPENELPFELNRVKTPNEFAETVDVEGPKIGFNRQ